MSRECDCEECYDLGWVFDRRPKLKPPLMLEFMPCLKPDCKASGQAIQNINFHGIDFVNVHREPGKERLMSISTNAISELDKLE